jgi:hypothetical protein
VGSSLIGRLSLPRGHGGVRYASASITLHAAFLIAIFYSDRPEQSGDPDKSGSPCVFRRSIQPDRNLEARNLVQTSQVFDDPLTPSPLPQRGEGDEIEFVARAPLGERVASPFALPLANGPERSEGAQGELREPGEGVTPRRSEVESR